MYIYMYIYVYITNIYLKQPFFYLLQVIEQTLLFSTAATGRMQSASLLIAIWKND